ncbi:hypothetical protein [Teredinibacter turnerae]|nr:hypothetical protein [Teredinibacter turnerae]
MNEIIEKIEKQVNGAKWTKAITSAVITAGVVAVVLFGHIQVIIGG